MMVTIDEPTARFALAGGGYARVRPAGWVAVMPPSGGQFSLTRGDIEQMLARLDAVDERRGGP